MFACQFGRYRYKRLPFGAVSAGDMFQGKNYLQGIKLMERVMTKQYRGCCRDVDRLI